MASPLTAGELRRFLALNRDDTLVTVSATLANGEIVYCSHLGYGTGQGGWIDDEGNYVERDEVIIDWEPGDETLRYPTGPYEVGRPFGYTDHPAAACSTAARAVIERTLVEAGHPGQAAVELAQTLLDALNAADFAVAPKTGA